MKHQRTKPKIFHSLLSMLLAIAVVFTTISLPDNTLNVQASWASSIVDSIGDGAAGGTNEVKNGVMYTRTGYFCYMLTADGQKVPGTKGIALASPGYNGVTGDTWYCRDRHGYYSASGWDGSVEKYWNKTPWTDGGKKTNEPEIKAWMEDKQPSGDPNAVMFVETWFGKAAAEGFAADKYVLVIETIMNFQYSISNGDGKGMSLADAKAKIKDLYGEPNGPVFMKAALANGVISDEFYNSWKNVYKQNPTGAEHLMMYVFNDLAYDVVKESQKSSKYLLVGEPVTGTVPELVKYKVNLGYPKTALDSYTNKTAPFTERIEIGGAGQRAGFRPWTGQTSKQISNEDVIDYGVAMMVVTANMDGQSTCDEPQQPSPHKAPDESKGTKSIVKNYRTHNLTDGTFTDDGCFVKTDVNGKIRIEDEEEYKLVGWKTSSTTQEIDSITWPVPGGGTQSGTSPETITMEVPDNCLYVLLEKVETTEEEEQDYNYKITQSSITRRIHLSNPDNWLSMPRIQDHTFTWVLGAHQTSCSGHTYYTACEGHSHKDSCPDDCSSSHNCGSNCVANTEYCSGFQWLDKTLKLSVSNTLKNNYPDILTTKDDWRAESEQGKLTKHWYKDDATFERGSTSAVVYTNSGWDYVCVIHRGKDKLTVADWKNSSLVNSDLRDVSGSGYAVANTLQGTRKLQDYYDKFSAQF